jgi:Kef-type K+ transport system membrane component KefB
MLMLNAGMNVPLHDERVRASLGRGALGAGVVAVLAVGAGLLVSIIWATGHPAIYAVLITSDSAAVVLPVIQERRLRGEAAMTVIAQAAVADVHEAAGTLLTTEQAPVGARPSDRPDHPVRAVVDRAADASVDPAATARPT